MLPGAEAEEAVQEAMARAWTRRHACRTPDAPLPWVLQITRNEAKRQLERRARLAGREIVVTHELEPEADDEGLARTAARVTVEQALQRLDGTDRDVIRLRYGEDLTQAEVARRLGMPEGTVKVRLHRARGRLRTLLEEGP